LASGEGKSRVKRKYSLDEKKGGKLGEEGGLPTKTPGEDVNPSGKNVLRGYLEHVRT